METLKEYLLKESLLDDPKKQAKELSEINRKIKSLKLIKKVLDDDSPRRKYLMINKQEVLNELIIKQLLPRDVAVKLSVDYPERVSEVIQYMLDHEDKLMPYDDFMDWLYSADHGEIATWCDENLIDMSCFYVIYYKWWMYQHDKWKF